MAEPSVFRDLSGQGRAGLDALLADLRHAVVALDYDGTLAPIVEDPAQAYPYPGVVDRLAELADRVGLVAVITGRPAVDAARFLDLDRRADLGGLLVLGQYGLERRDGTTGEITAAEPPPGIGDARSAIPSLLDGAGAGDADIEDKGLAVAVHVRRSADPQGAFRRIVAPLTELGERLGLRVEPGRFVVELRQPGVDKGSALAGLLAEIDAHVVLVAGDDLGDVAAFEAAERFRESGAGRAALLVCSGSDEVEELAARADLVVDGPSGVSQLLSELVHMVEGSRGC